MDIKEIIGDYREFLDKVFANLASVDIDVSNYQIDHLAYRTDTIEKYDDIKNELLNCSTYIGENIVRSRPIGFFRLNNSLTYHKFMIPIIELIAPVVDEEKFGNQLEHAEFVIDGDLNSFLSKYPNFNFKTSFERKINPEIKAKFQDGVNVSFHKIPIDKAYFAQKAAGEL